MCIHFNHLRRFVLILFGVAGLVCLVVQNTAADTIEQLGNGAYLYLNGQNRSLFIVSDAGVIVTDPINEKVAVAYRAAIATITDQPVRFVVYSHYHWDRVSGAGIFKQQGAQIIAQQRCAERFRENPNPAIITPDLTFADRYTVTLGNRALELYYFGPSHGDCLTVFVAQPANIMQITDVVNPPAAGFPANPLVPYIRPHNLPQFFAATEELIDQLGIEELAASAVFPGSDDVAMKSPPLAPVSIVREQAEFWKLIDATVKRAAAERRVGIDGFVRLRDDEFAAFESYPGYHKEDLPLILRRFIGFHDMGR